MDAKLLRVLAALGLRWTERDLAACLEPYRLGELVGEGGVALVYAARAPGDRSDRFVVKMPRFPAPDEVFGMSWQTCLDALVHERVVLWHCAGLGGVVQVRADRMDRPLPHLVLDRLGPSLDDVVGPNGDDTFDLAAAVSLARQLASTVRRMHDLGVCHWDISPRNVLRGRGRRWVLIDPSPPELATEDFADRGLGGEQRDVLGIARTFLLAYYGVSNLEDLPGSDELEDHPELFAVLRDMLNRSPEGIPSARDAETVLRRVRIAP